MPAALSLDCKLRCLAYQGYSAKDIASCLGMNEQVIRRKLAEYNISVSKVSNQIPYGLSNHSYQLRAQLGMILTDMITKCMLSPEISECTGLNQREIGRAKDHPYDHDWKLSQIERTLKQEGKTLNDIS